MALPGYERIPGSSRYRDKRTGLELSKRAYDDIRARKAGFKNYRQYQQKAKDKEYSYWVKSQAEKLGVSVRQVRSLNSEFNKKYAATFYRKDGSEIKLRNMAGGPKDRWLQYLGFRRPGMNWPVGQTDKVISQYGSIEAAMAASENDIGI